MAVGSRSSSTWSSLMTGGPEPTLVFGTNFRLVDGRYLVWLSKGGDLVAGPIDLDAGRVGRSVRTATGPGRMDYSDAGTYALSASGTLVWARGANRAVGHLVSAAGSSLDTLPVGAEAFLRFNVSPDGRRLAAVVESLEGERPRTRSGCPRPRSSSRPSPRRCRSNV